ncbi:MAG TPA: PadR family transcriptional regulator [Candidatus Corynebacterium gallistercoris]|uniref:PadR family transcriptional regulator n=1 Tax=Candidatus Corynebacterium gallistercoris TaxID=2838530 RepID=A0A9D1RZH8_9CORY|nr:PadR family transcriptional regulator [Candidatus Corynebacterium gallistercoris]
MALEHAILVSLAERPGSGYQLSRQFAKSIGHFWSTTHQQIYRTLKKLQDQGLITARDVAQEGKPDKKIYQLTHKGQEELSAWVATPTDLPQLRSDFGVKLRGAEHTDRATIVSNVAHHRALHAEQLALYRRYLATQFPSPDTLTGRQLHQYLVLRGGITSEEAFLAWCDEILTTLGTAPSKEEADDQP